MSSKERTSSCFRIPRSQLNGRIEKALCLLSQFGWGTQDVWVAFCHVRLSRPDEIRGTQDNGRRIRFIPSGKHPAGAGLLCYRPIAKGSTSREPHLEHRHRRRRSATVVRGLCEADESLDPSFVRVVVIVNIDGVVNPQIGDIAAG